MTTFCVQLKFETWSSFPIVLSCNGCILAPFFLTSVESTALSVFIFCVFSHMKCLKRVCVHAKWNWLTFKYCRFHYRTAQLVILEKFYNSYLYVQHLTLESRNFTVLSCRLSYTMLLTELYSARSEAQKLVQSSKFCIQAKYILSMQLVKRSHFRKIRLAV